MVIQAGNVIMKPRKKEKFIDPATIAKLKRPDLLEMMRQIFEHGNSALAKQTKEKTPSLYDVLHSDAVTAGIAVARPRDVIAEKRQALGLNPHGVGYAPAAMPNKETQEAIHEFSREDVDKYYRGTGLLAGDGRYNIVKLKAEQPERGYKLELAARYYGVLLRDPTPPATHAVEGDGKTTLSDEQCDSLGLKRGTRATIEEVADATVLLHQLEEQKAAAAAAPPASPALAPAAPPVEPPAPPKTAAATT